MASQPIGTFALVLHTHLPWLNHHGRWPVGEEWLHQAWATSYDRVLDLLHRLAAQGHRDLLTLGITPVLAAQLDDPYSLGNQHTWLGFWQTRAAGLAGSGDASAHLGNWEYRRASAALQRFEDRWRHGGSAVIRPLVDHGVIDLLSGPAAHPFQPLLEAPMMRASLSAGLDDGILRWGSFGGGIWAPECGYAPGLEREYARAGVTHFMMDGPTLRHVGRSTTRGYPIGDSDVVAFGRDLDVSYRVWSPRKGYPGGKWYRDFHTYGPRWGFQHARVTGKGVPGPEKAMYEPERAAAAVKHDAADFIGHVRRRLETIRAQEGQPGLVVAAYDTELFGHWWDEGPQWLEAVLTAMPAAGIRVTTLQGALDQGLVAAPVQPEAGSWGAGKGFQTWAGESVRDIVSDNDHLQRTVLKTLASVPAEQHLARSLPLDQLLRSALLALASDWAFMITKDSAAEYARRRHFFHHSDTHRLAAVIEQHGAESVAAHREADAQRLINGPFGHLDARRVSTAGL